MAHCLIVGAGPAGAALGYLLARRGVQVTLFERHGDFAREFRGEVLLPGGLDALAQMGLGDALEAVPQVRLNAFELFVNRRRRRRLEFDPSLFGEFSPRWMSQPALLELLVAEASKNPSFRLERGATVRGLLEEEGRFVGVRLQTDEGEREVRGDLVVGADGRTSVVRKRAGLPEQRDPLPMDVVWFKVPLPGFLSGDRPLRAYVGRGHLLVAAPVYDGNLQVAWIIRKGSYGELRRREISEWIEEMAGHVSPDLAEHLRAHKQAAISPFLLGTVSDRVLHWSAPGLLVIGDAAHTMSPVGGQGLNIALRDAIVAANHLVPVLAGSGNPEEIDAATRRVQEEREPEVSQIQRFQAAPPRVILSRAWWSRILLGIAPLFIRTDLARGRAGVFFRRFAFGVTDVRLQV